MANLGAETGGYQVATQVSVNNPAGITIGQSSTDLISFYNVTPVAQAAQPNTLTAANAVTAGGAIFGFSTSAQANNLVTLVNQIRAALVGVGLMTGP